MPSLYMYIISHGNIPGKFGLCLALRAPVSVDVCIPTITVMLNAFTIYYFTRQHTRWIWTSRHITGISNIRLCIPTTTVMLNAYTRSSPELPPDLIWMVGINERITNKLNHIHIHVCTIQDSNHFKTKWHHEPQITHDQLARMLPRGFKAPKKPRKNA